METGAATQPSWGRITHLRKDQEGHSSSHFPGTSSLGLLGQLGTQLCSKAEVTFGHTWQQLLQQIKSRTKCKREIEAGATLSKFDQGWIRKMENSFVWQALSCWQRQSPGVLLWTGEFAQQMLGRGCCAQELEAKWVKAGEMKLEPEREVLEQGASWWETGQATAFWGSCLLGRTVGITYQRHTQASLWWKQPHLHQLLLKVLISAVELGIYSVTTAFTRPTQRFNRNFS